MKTQNKNADNALILPVESAAPVLATFWPGGPMDAATNRQLSSSATLFPARSLQGFSAKALNKTSQQTGAARNLLSGNLLLGGDTDGGLLATFDTIFQEITQPTMPANEQAVTTVDRFGSQQTTSETGEGSRSESTAAETAEPEEDTDRTEEVAASAAFMQQTTDFIDAPQSEMVTETEADTPSLAIDDDGEAQSNQPQQLDNQIVRDSSLSDSEKTRRDSETTHQDDHTSRQDAPLQDLHLENDEKQVEEFAAAAFSSQQTQTNVRDARNERKNDDELVAENGLGIQQLALQDQSAEKQSEVVPEEKIEDSTVLDSEKQQQTMANDAKGGGDTGERNARSERLAEIAREGREDSTESSSSQEMQEILAQMDPVDTREFYGDSLASTLEKTNNPASQTITGLSDTSALAAQTAATATTTTAPSPGTPGGSASEGSPASTSSIDGTSPTSSRLKTAPQEGKGAGEGANTSNAERVRLVQRVARAFQKLGDGGGQVHMMLRPAELGSVRLDLTVKGNSLEATLTAQSEAAVEALRDNLGELRSRLEEFGMEIERIEIRKADPSSLTQENSSEGRNQGSGYQDSGYQNSSGSSHDPGASREGRRSLERSRRDSQSSSVTSLQTSNGPRQNGQTRSSKSLDLML